MNPSILSSIRAVMSLISVYNTYYSMLPIVSHNSICVILLLWYESSALITNWYSILTSLSVRIFSSSARTLNASSKVTSFTPFTEEYLAKKIFLREIAPFSFPNNRLKRSFKSFLTSSSFDSSCYLSGLFLASWTKT